MLCEPCSSYMVLYSVSAGVVLHGALHPVNFLSCPQFSSIQTQFCRQWPRVLQFWQGLAYKEYLGNVAPLHMGIMCQVLNQCTSCEHICAKLPCIVAFCDVFQERHADVITDSATAFSSYSSARQFQ